MLLLFVMGILLVGTVILANMMSIFFPFFQQLGSITNYNRAYYGAVSGIERSMLVLKNHQPGFEGSGGWIKDQNIGPDSDSTYRQKFGIDGRNNNSLFWNITSRITSNTIPKVGQSDIDSDYKNGNEGFDALTYSNPRGVALGGVQNSSLEQIFLYYDNTTNTGDYYKKVTNISQANPTQIFLNIQYPKLYGASRPLDTNSDIDGDLTKDDSIVSWSLVGLLDNSPFSIKQIQNFGQDGAGNYVINEGDTTIRESDINAMNSNSLPNIIFGGQKSIVPRNGGLSLDLPKYQNVNPVNSELSGQNFSQIFQNSRVTNKILAFGLINLPQTDDGYIYPFLKYKVTFPQNLILPDKYYNIVSDSKVGNHEVKINIKKPVSNTSIFSDFSIVF